MFKKRGNKSKQVNKSTLNLNDFDTEQINTIKNEIEPKDNQEGSNSSVIESNVSEIKSKFKTQKKKVNILASTSKVGFEGSSSDSDENITKKISMRPNLFNPQISVLKSNELTKNIFQASTSEAQNNYSEEALKK